jgi:Uma2 family endonuclease
MATVPAQRLCNDYPSGDGKPMAETDWHRDLMAMLIDILRRFFVGQRVYVSGNLLVFYDPGNRRRRVSPDVFVVRQVEPCLRPNYLVWEESRAPEVVIELTSKKTRREDLTTKLALYQDILRVREYFLFDPRADYLVPQLQGFRLRKQTYQPIRPQRRRLPSRILGLHLEHAGDLLRLWNPVTETWLPTHGELMQQAQQRDQLAEEHIAEIANQRAQRVQQRANTAEQRAAELAAQLERLRRPVPPTQPK